MDIRRVRDELCKVSKTHYISKRFRVHWLEVFQDIPSKLKASSIPLQIALQLGTNNPAISGLLDILVKFMASSHERITK